MVKKERKASTRIDPGRFKVNPPKPKYALWSVALVSLIFLFFALSFLFAGATIIIDPKVKDANLDKDFSAVRGNNPDTLPFDVVLISGQYSKSVPISGEQEIKEAARGQAMLYNAWSSSPQILSKDTRLFGSNDKVYKIAARTTIPGKERDGVPGRVEVSIYAAEPGEGHNSGPLDFKIPGFEGTPKYSQIYGRSKGDITGGISGTYGVISEEVRKNTEEELKKALREKLIKQARDQTPPGFILFDGAAFLDVLEKAEPQIKTSGEGEMKLSGSLTGFLFDEQKLWREITETVIEGYDGAPVEIVNVRDLSFSLLSEKNLSGDGIKNISFHLSGPVKIVWQVDASLLKEEAAGKKKKDFPAVLGAHPSVSSAVLKLRPFWKRSFPEESEDIEIIVNEPK